MSKQQLPDLSLHIGEFDMIFESISPHVYIKHLYRLIDERDLFSGFSYDLKLLSASGDIDTDGFVPHTTFALEQQRYRSFSLWAVGTVYTRQSGDIRVSGRIGITDWFFVSLVIFIVLGYWIALDSEQPVKTFTLIVMTCVVIHSVHFLVFYLSKGKLIDLLRKSRT